MVIAQIYYSECAFEAGSRVPPADMSYKRVEYGAANSARPSGLVERSQSRRRGLIELLNSVSFVMSDFWNLVGGWSP